MVVFRCDQKDVPAVCSACTYSSVYYYEKDLSFTISSLKVLQRSEPVATDTVYSDTPAIDDESTCAQIFVGTKTLVTDAYGVKSDMQFINTLENNIRKRGAIDKFISNSAQSELSKHVKDALRALLIDYWQSKAYHQH